MSYFTGDESPSEKISQATAAHAADIVSAARERQDAAVRRLFDLDRPDADAQAAWFERLSRNPNLAPGLRV